MLQITGFGCSLPGMHELGPMSRCTPPTRTDSRTMKKERCLFYNSPIQITITTKSQGREKAIGKFTRIEGSCQLVVLSNYLVNPRLRPDFDQHFPSRQSKYKSRHIQDHWTITTTPLSLPCQTSTAHPYSPSALAPNPTLHHPHHTPSP